MLSARQGIAIAIQSKLNVPEFKIYDTYTPEQQREYHKDPDYEVIDDIVMPVSDIEIDQVIYIKDGHHYPVLFINDRYLLSGSQGALLPANLVTSFPGRILKTTQLQNIAKIIPEQGYITITFTLINDTLCFKSLQQGVHTDYVPHLIALHNENSAEWFHYNLESLRLPEPSGMAVSARLYSYPYGEANLEIVEQFPGLDAVLLADGCYAAFKYGKKERLKALWKELYADLDDSYMTYNGLVFNPDGGIKARKVIKALKKADIL